MEEVDNIIIDSLKNLQCEIDDNVQSLKDFTPDIIVNAISCCLEAIIPGSKLPKKLAPSMNQKLKLATQLADQIKDLGFRGDMGYQSILYCNEVEIRRVLMFLIERLPRDSVKSTGGAEVVGFVPRLIKDIEESVRISLQKPWIPTTVLKDGVRDCGGKFIRQSFGNALPLQTVELEVPKTLEFFGGSEELKRQYWVRHLPTVTQQCPPNKLIPSLLFKDNEFSIHQIKLASLKNEMESEVEKILSTDKRNNLITNIQNENTQKQEDQKLENQENVEKHQNQNQSQTEEKMKKLYEEIEAAKAKYSTLQNEFKKTDAKLSQLFTIKEKEDAILKDILTKVKVKQKTLTVLSKEENMAKLKALVENGSERLVQLANQWNDVQSPLLEQYNTLKQSLSSQELRMQQEQEKIKTIKEKNSALARELKEKETLEVQLTQEVAKLPKNTNRSAYTRRILEIIGNIKKQNDEIQKVLRDTKEVQKDINNLNGQIDRSFTISDELIFRDCKQDETARKAYKLLAALHTECEDVIQTVTNLGLVERESRNLEEQIDAETAKGMQAKLERVQNDLLEVRKEAALLIKHQQRIPGESQSQEDDIKIEQIQNV